MPDAMDILWGEKNPSFKQDARIEGNLSVVVHPSNPTMYGDGSVEIGGTLSTDTLSSATPDSYIQVNSPLHLSNRYTDPPSPIAGSTQLYADGNTNQLKMVDSQGRRYELIPPLDASGDIMTYREQGQSTVRLPAGKPGERLAVDPEANPASLLRWLPDRTGSRDIPLINQESDEAKYVQLSGPATITEVLATAHFPVPLPRLSRSDPAYSLSQDALYVTLLQAGVYSLRCKITVKAGASIDRLAARLEKTDATGGYFPLQGGELSTIEVTEGAVRTLYSELSFSAHAGNRVRLRMLPSTTGTYTLEPDSVVLSLVTRTGTKETFAIGSEGTVSIGSDYTIVPCNVSVIDSLGSSSGGAITTPVNGSYRLYARVSFGPGGVSTGDMQVQVNGANVAQGRVINGSGYIYQLLNLTAGDRVLLLVRAAGSANVTLSQACLSMSAPDVGTWQCVRVPFGDSDQLRTDRFSTLPLLDKEARSLAAAHFQFPLSTTDRCERIILRTGGTYLIAFTGIAHGGALVQAKVGTSDGRLINVYLFDSEAVDPSGGEGNLVSSVCSFFPPNSTLSFHGLRSGTIETHVSDGVLLIQRISEPLMMFTGSTEFGSRYLYKNNDAEVIITAGSQYTDHVSLQTPTLPAGRYRVGYTIECDVSSPGETFEVRTLLDDVIIDSITKRPVATGVYDKVCAFLNLSVSGDDSHIVRLQTRLPLVSSQAALKVRNGAIELIRVE